MQKLETYLKLFETVLPLENILHIDVFINKYY